MHLRIKALVIYMLDQWHGQIEPDNHRKASDSADSITWQLTLRQCSRPAGAMQACRIQKLVSRLKGTKQKWET